MYFTHIIFHKHQHIERARAPSPPVAKLIKCLRTNVGVVELTQESGGFVCLTKAGGGEREKDGNVQVKSVGKKGKQRQADTEMILER